MAAACGTEIPVGRLVFAEALEFVHGAFHILAGGIGGGTDTLNAEVEIVRVRGAQQGFFECDEVARIEIEERLIERLHAVLAGSGGDGLADHASLVRIDDAIANVSGRNHDFDRRHASRTVALADQTLADDRLERPGELQTNLLLLRRREDGDDALNRFRRVERATSKEPGGRFQPRAEPWKWFPGRAFRRPALRRGLGVTRRGGPSRTTTCPLRLHAD